MKSFGLASLFLQSKKFRLFHFKTIRFNSQMKSLSILFILLISLSSYAGVSILSDLDDTIKITQAGESSDILGDDIYLGMNDFFEGAKSYSSSLHILSASPGLLRTHIVKTLKKSNIEFESLTLRKNIFGDKFTYKVRVIESIMNSTSDDFIFVGDDLGKDPEVYAEIEKRYPSRVLAKYIHVVEGREIPAEVTPYWTSFDLAMREFIAGRMDADKVESMVDKFMKETSLDFVFPKKAQCPNESQIWDWQIQTVFQQEASTLIKKFVRFCQQRQSGKG